MSRGATSSDRAAPARRSLQATSERPGSCCAPAQPSSPPRSASSRPSSARPLSPPQPRTRPAQTGCARRVDCRGCLGRQERDEYDPDRDGECARSRSSRARFEPRPTRRQCHRPVPAGPRTHWKELSAPEGSRSRNHTSRRSCEPQEPSQLCNGVGDERRGVQRGQAEFVPHR